MVCREQDGGARRSLKLVTSTSEPGVRQVSHLVFLGNSPFPSREFSALIFLVFLVFSPGRDFLLLHHLLYSAGSVHRPRFNVTQCLLRESVSGWKQRWMDGWTDGQMIDGWMGGWMDKGTGIM